MAAGSAHESHDHLKPSRLSLKRGQSLIRAVVLWCVRGFHMVGSPRRGHQVESRDRANRAACVWSGVRRSAYVCSRRHVTCHGAQYGRTVPEFCDCVVLLRGHRTRHCVSRVVHVRGRERERERESHGERDRRERDWSVFNYVWLSLQRDDEGACLCVLVELITCLAQIHHAGNLAVDVAA